MTTLEIYFVGSVFVGIGGLIWILTGRRIGIKVNIAGAQSTLGPFTTVLILVFVWPGVLALIVFSLIEAAIKKFTSIFRKKTE